MNNAGFTDVRTIGDGGDGVPTSVYRCTFKGDTLRVFACGQARRALEWLAGRDCRFAVYSVINGVAREVARGR